MTLRRALDDYKRRRNHARQFPGERRSTNGTFSGLDERLVYVDRQGRLRDHTYPLSGLSGIERSRFGLTTLDGRAWFDEFDPVSQGYVDETALVETRLDGGDRRVRQLDLTVGPVHCTRYAVEGDVPVDPTLHAFFDLAPENQESRLGKLEHANTLEVHHQRQHNFVSASTGVDAVHGQLPEQFEELVSSRQTVTYPRRRAGGARYEDALLNGTVVVEVPLDARGEGPATTTVISLLADTTETGRAAALEQVRTAADRFDSAETLRTAAREQVPLSVPAAVPRRDLVLDDLRVLELLSAPSGAHVAAPDMDPFYVYTGGYGYTWFRDDAEIVRSLLEGGRHLDLDLGSRLDDAAAFYLDTQLDDGTWPHRVWAWDGRIAPGWAHARLEAGEDVDYQADQTASVAAFLGRYLRLGDPAAPGDLEAGLRLAVEGLDATREDGFPIECQNAWENMTGRFLHTAGTYLQGYAAVARAPVDADLRQRAREGAEAVYAGLDRLWIDDEGLFALRETADGVLDARADSGSMALAAAHRAYDAVGGVDDRRREQLIEHFETSLDRLYRETDTVEGLCRFEGDEWRRRVQDSEKVWSVSTVWGASACSQLGALLDGPEAASFYRRARDLFDAVDADGSLVLSNGYLPEQVFDDGTPDCATPLGWPHAVRLATVARLDAAGELY